MGPNVTPSLPMRLILFWLPFCALPLTRSSSTYKAAYADWWPNITCRGGPCTDGAAWNAEAVKAYAEIARSAAEKGAQVLVFPENGITDASTLPKKWWIEEKYAEAIPDVKAGERAVPCDAHETFAGTPTTVALSCMAKENSLVIVANLVDYQKVKGTDRIYNTQVAFDTDGAYLLKYHKMNLWGEPEMDQPTECQDPSFTSSFGEAFGVIVCADAMNAYPTLTLIDRGIRNILMSAHWTEELPAMQVQAYVQGLSQRHNLNIVLSNYNGRWGGGSGIWSSGQARAYSYRADGDIKTGVRVAEVPSKACGGQTKLSVALPAPQGSQRSPHFFDLLTRPDPGTSNWVVKELSEGLLHPVCQKGFCCNATVSGGYTKGSAGYLIAALNGEHRDGSVHWPARICAVVACSVENFPWYCPTDFSKHSAATYDLTGITVEASSVNPVGTVPEVMAFDRFQDEVTLPSSFTVTQRGTAVLTAMSAAANPLKSVVVYERPFGKEKKPYNCPQPRRRENSIFFV